MGLEAETTLRRGPTRTRGRALLEGDRLVFRSPQERLEVRLADMAGLQVGANGVLQITTPVGVIELELGEAAEKWRTRIANPPSLVDKLGVKGGMRVSVIGVEDAAFEGQLRARTSDISRRPRLNSDLIFFGAEDVASLARLTQLRGMLVETGAIWVVHRKGKAATLRDVDVFAAARRAGLVDNKVVAFSDTHTAERLVIPLAARRGTASRKTSASTGGSRRTARGK
jgi:hypothetical protein